MPEAIVWGASGGIGAALVKQLKTNDWRVFAAARHEDRVPPEADHVIGFDAGDIDSIREVSLVIAHETEGVDLVVYAAGGVHADKLDDIAPEAWQTVLDANLTGAQRAIQVSLNLLKPEGHVMVIGAKVDKIMLPKFGAYAAAKAGLEPMLAIMQKENRKRKFTLVRPGAVDTPFWDNVPFSLPKGAMSPGAVAEAMMQHYSQGGNGHLDL